LVEIFVQELLDKAYFIFGLQYTLAILSQFFIGGFIPPITLMGIAAEG